MENFDNLDDLNYLGNLDYRLLSTELPVVRQIACGPPNCLWSAESLLVRRIAFGPPNRFWSPKLPLIRRTAFGPLNRLWSVELPLVRRIAFGPSNCLWSVESPLVRRIAFGPPNYLFWKLIERNIQLKFLDITMSWYGAFSGCVTLAIAPRLIHIIQIPPTYKKLSEFP